MRKEENRTDAITQIVSALSEKERWLVLAHEKPDGDTLGCACAMASVGRRLSKDVLLGGPDAIPERYSFLPEAASFQVLHDVPTHFQNRQSAVICLDTSTLERAIPGLTRENGREYLLANIDHHPDNACWGDLNWVERSASATGEMLTELFLQANWDMKPNEASALYTALITDNGDFSFASTTEYSHECAIELMRAGAKPSDIVTYLTSNLHANVLKLWSRAFARVYTFAGGLGAIFWLDCEDFATTCTSKEDTENLVNYLLRIKGVKLAALCTELPDYVRVSLRARPPYSARDVAHVFGGGGHELASGCTIHGRLLEALSLIHI